MKVILLLSCLTLGAYAVRVKRVVGGEKAAIPQPIPNFQQTNTASKPNSNEKATTPNPPKKPSMKGGSSEEASDKTLIDNNSPDTVSIYEEDRTAKISGIREKDGYISFKGIPYAEPPLGRNRFQRPILAYLKGKVEAFDYGSPCVQPLPDYSGITGNEDCLYLNVYTPSVYSRNASGLPVLFWIHGGGFMRGSGNQYGVRDLVKKNIVVVTMNYRLGTLGFLGSTEKEMAGNAALFDIRAAFEWTKRYIAYFGGNHRHIFTAGQGSGASVAMLLAQSSFTSGFIQGVFAMSGTGISSSAVDYTPDNTSQFISQTTHCKGLKPLNTVKCLQSCDLKAIIKVQNILESERIGDGGFVNGVSKLLSAGPMVEGKNDGRFLPFFLNNNPLDALKNKETAKDIPLLIGTTKSETGKAVTGKYKNDVAKRLKIPEFLENILPHALLDSNVGLFTNGTVNALIKALFNNKKYLSFITTTLTEGLNQFQKVIEATTDALFNLPAATTSTLWDGDSYFYSFQYESEQVHNFSFLEGSSLVAPSSASTEKTPSHGEDLIYLFEPHTLEGKLIPSAVLKNQKDLKVKEIFVSVVSDFLKCGMPSLSSSDEEWSPFKEDNTYAIISDKPKIDRKFRFCQIALWGGFTDKLTNPFCKLPGISDILKLIPENLLNGGLLSSPVKKILSGTVLKDQVSQLSNGLTNHKQLPLDTSSLNHKQLPLGTSNLSNSLLGGKVTDSMKSKSTTAKPKEKSTAKTPIAHLQLQLPGALG